ncbi:glutamate-5-semialdehyde dehydrogenase [Candidatus Bathyarchaeota archaeon]|nr:glutamate-5-semialdehyde dehydrogenase [Candidatus Bathyarchaeota archaeon]MBL7078947.1 glutamate-5-semialdehyde dehydrogenase [Candidatus Bathyarchaeota archaeon]
MSDIIQKAKFAREASYALAKLPGTVRDQELGKVAEAIWRHREAILEANARDLEAAEEMLRKGEITGAMIKRLELNPEKIRGIVEMVRGVASQEDPLGKTEYAMELDEGLELFRVSSPIGVIAVIFESRPDALVQIASLCLKSGNCVLLKGGSEARNTNQRLFEVIRDAADAVPGGWIHIVEARREVGEILKMDDYVDLIVPRGSNDFVRYIQSNTRIPVLGHADGVCHVYVDSEADVPMALDVCYDAKVQYPSVCNAVDAILVHEAVAPWFLPGMVDRFLRRGVEVRGDARVRGIVEEGVLEATDEDWGAEYLDYVVAIKVVDNVEEAINHVNKYGSHHTDAIVTSNEGTALGFLESVDSASVFWNASTRFADGYRYGLGSELGISTGKIHVRGPTGLEGLTTYKYYLRGGGHIVADYASGGSRQFTHRSLDREWKRKL